MAAAGGSLNGNRASYGMLPPNAACSVTVRPTFVIDPDGVIRATITYPKTVGRNVEESLRLVEALRMTEESNVLTPEGWRPGDQIIMQHATDVRRCRQSSA